MLLSARKVFSKNDAGWDDYLAFIKLPLPHVIYSIDPWLNPCELGSAHLSRMDEIAALQGQLPDLSDSGREYYQLAINIDEEAIPALPENIAVLGFDLCDETHTSSLLNCGPWIGKLEPVAKRINRFGLLALEDAKLAKELLPEVWGKEEPHALVSRWCICNLSQAR